MNKLKYYRISQWSCNKKQIHFLKIHKLCMFLSKTRAAMKTGDFVNRGLYVDTVMTGTSCVYHKLLDSFDFYLNIRGVSFLKLKDIFSFGQAFWDITKETSGYCLLWYINHQISRGAYITMQAYWFWNSMGKISVCKKQMNILLK